MNKAQIEILKKEIDFKIIEAIDSWEEKKTLFTEYPLLDALFEVIDLYFSIKNEDSENEKFE